MQMRTFAPHNRNTETNDRADANKNLCTAEDQQVKRIETKPVNINLLPKHAGLTEGQHKT